MKINMQHAAIGAVLLFVAYRVMAARKAANSPTAPTAQQKTAGDWWAFAGSWQ